MPKLTADDEITAHFKKYVKMTDEFEVWVLGTWDSETCHATVVFSGTQADCIEHRKTSENRSNLSIRPTSRLTAA
jgi:hypothetical protein